MPWTPAQSAQLASCTSTFASFFCLTHSPTSRGRNPNACMRHRPRLLIAGIFLGIVAVRDAERRLIVLGMLQAELDVAPQSLLERDQGIGVAIGDLLQFLAPARP